MNGKSISLVLLPCVNDCWLETASTNHEPGVTTIPNWRGMAVRAGKCFAHSIVAIPEIYCSDRLPMVEQEQIMSTSKSLLDIRGIVVIPKLEESSFETNVSDNIHWTPETANNMLTHWLDHLN